jgi:prepilin-type N-terminal cleavage/methylation domain-containing protein
VALKKKKGFTLIELIVAIAILGILCIAFLPMFVQGFKAIATAGRRSKANYDTQKNVEKDIDDRLVSAGADSLRITSSMDSTFFVDVPGEEKTETTTFEGRNVVITFFMPDR